MTRLLTSALLAREGFLHGFSTREGGVSEPPFASMNLARAVGDEPRLVEENYRRFAALLGIEPSRLFETSQVHGANVKSVHEDDDVLATRALEADALVTRLVGTAVGVRVADCVPILLADPETGAVAAVHAGWRGCTGRVLDRAIEALTDAPGRIVAAIGPHIGPASFEVGEDVAAEIAAVAHGAHVIVRGWDKPHVDLERVVRAQLLAAGLDEGRIERVGGCTFTDETRFHSFRRDGKRSGRLLGAIVARVGSTPSTW